MTRGGGLFRLGYFEEVSQKYLSFVGINKDGSLCFSLIFIAHHFNDFLDNLSINLF